MGKLDGYLSNEKIIMNSYNQNQVSSENRPRIDFIDWARGFAAFLVVMQHSFESFSPGFYSWSLEYVNFGMVGVICFFLISGYVIAHTADNKSIPMFLIQRFFRIFPLYWFLLFLGMSTAIYWYKTPDIKVAIANVFLIQDYIGLVSYVGGSWTLPLELAFYTLFILRKSSYFMRNNSSILWFFALIISVLISMRIFLDIKIPLGRMLLIYAAFQSTLWYEKKYTDLKKGKEARVNFFLLISVVLYYVSLNENPLFSPLCLFFSWIIGHLLFFMFSKTKPVTIIANILTWMGKVSYSVYLCQGLILTWISFLKLPLVCYLLTIPFAYLFAQLIHHLIEQPGIRLGKNIVKTLYSKVRI